MIGSFVFLNDLNDSEHSWCLLFLRINHRDPIGSFSSHFFFSFKEKMVNFWILHINKFSIAWLIANLHISRRIKMFLFFLSYYLLFIMLMFLEACLDNALKRQACSSGPISFATIKRWKNHEQADRTMKIMIQMCFLKLRNLDKFIYGQIQIMV